MNYNKLAEEVFLNILKRTTPPAFELITESTRGENGVLGCLLQNNNSASAGKLSTELKVSTARMACILTSLENKAYIVKLTDKRDKRKTIVNITKEGIDYINNTKICILNMIEDILQKLGKKDALEFARINEKITNIINYKHSL